MMAVGCVSTNSGPSGPIAYSKPRISPSRPSLIIRRFFYSRASSYSADERQQRKTGLTEREIRTRLAFLAKSGNLTTRSTNRFSIITIVNWDIYQGTANENDRQNDQLPTNKRPHTNTQTHEHRNNRRNHVETKAIGDKKHGPKSDDAAYPIDGEF